MQDGPGLFRWRQPDLARAAYVGVSTVDSFELERRTPIDANMAAIRYAFDAAGVEFIDANGGGPGVRPRV